MLQLCVPTPVARLLQTGCGSPHTRVPAVYETLWLKCKVRQELLEDTTPISADRPQLNCRHISYYKTRMGKTREELTHTSFYYVKPLEKCLFPTSYKMVMLTLRTCGLPEGSIGLEDIIQSSKKRVFSVPTTYLCKIRLQFIMRLIYFVS